MNAKNVLIASAVAMLFVTGAVNARADQSAGSDQVKCVGGNSCKGQSACKSAQNDCKGKNACKRQGFLKTAEQKYKNKGGTVASTDSHYSQSKRPRLSRRGPAGPNVRLT